MWRRNGSSRCTNPSCRLRFRGVTGVRNAGGADARERVEVLCGAGLVECCATRTAQTARKKLQTASREHVGDLEEFPTYKLSDLALEIGQGRRLLPIEDRSHWGGPWRAESTTSDRVEFARQGDKVETGTLDRGQAARPAADGDESQDWHRETAGWDVSAPTLTTGAPTLAVWSAGGASATASLTRVGEPNPLMLTGRRRSLLQPPRQVRLR